MISALLAAVLPYPSEGGQGNAPADHMVSAGVFCAVKGAERRGADFFREIFANLFFLRQFCCIITEKEQRGYTCRKIRGSVTANTCA